jgi:peptidoglycan/LPS O-acetylase OafA/YrhL
MSAPVTVPDAVAPPPKHPRFAMIDGARAIAVMSIVVYHAAVFGRAVSGTVPGRLIGHLNIGVAIFFLISGFLLYRPFIAHRAGGPPAPTAADYVKRRLLRIYPAYWLALTVLLLLPGLTGSIPGNRLALYSLFHSKCLTGPFPTCQLAQTWSLVVELSFYIVLPFYVIVVGRLTRRLRPRAWLRAELVTLAGLSAVSLALEFGLFSNTPTWIDATLVGHFLWFALGMGMAVVSAALTGRVLNPRRIPLAAARPGISWALALVVYAASCAWLPAFIGNHGQSFGSTLAFGVTAALLLLPAVFAEGRTSIPERVLTQPVIAWVGLISYGIFLWHYAITLDLGFLGRKEPFVLVLLGTLAIVIPVAAASYYLLERPLLRLKYRRLRPGALRPSTDRASRARAR